MINTIRGSLIEIDNLSKLDDLYLEKDNGMYILNNNGTLDINFLYEVIASKNICKQIRFKFSGYDSTNSNEDLINERYRINNIWTPWFGRSTFNRPDKYNDDTHKVNITDNIVDKDIVKKKDELRYDPKPLENIINNYVDRSELDRKLPLKRNNVRNGNNHLYFTRDIRINDGLKFENLDPNWHNPLKMTYNGRPGYFVMLTHGNTAGLDFNDCMPRNGLDGWAGNCYVLYGGRQVREILIGTGNEDRLWVDYFNGETGVGWMKSAIEWDFEWKSFWTFGEPGTQTEPANGGFRAPDWAREILVQQVSNQHERHSVRTFWFNARGHDVSCIGTSNPHVDKNFYDFYAGYGGYRPNLEGGVNKYRHHEGFNCRYEAGAKTLRRNYGFPAETQGVHWSKVWYR